MRRRYSLLLGVVFSAFFLWLALRGLNWRDIGTILENARWQYLLLAFIIWTLGLGARAIRWYYLLGKEVPIKPTYHILNIGFLINNTLPLRVGELARAYLVGRQSPEVSGWSVLSTIVAERIIDLITVVLLLGAVLPVLAVERSAVSAGFALGFIAIISFCVLLLFAHHPNWPHDILSRLTRALPVLNRLGLRELLDRILHGLKPLTTWQGLLNIIIWTAVSWFFSVAGAWVLGLVFTDLPQTGTMRAALSLSVAAASLSIIVPFTLASVGPFEAAAVFALMTASVPQEVAVAYSIVWHTGVVVTYALWGAVGMVGMGLSFTQVQQGAATFRQ